MQVIKQIVKVPADRQLRIELPEEALADEEAEVIVLFNIVPSSQKQKLAAMREATSDPLYLDDLNETMEDFRYADKDDGLL